MTDLIFIRDLKCFLFGHKYFETRRLGKNPNTLYRVCTRCGKTQFLTGEPDGRLFWIDEE